MQRLSVLVALMLVRQRQPPTNAAVTAELGAAVVSLPSGLLAMIGEAIARVESRLEARPRLSRRALLAQAAAHTCASVRARGQKPKAVALAAASRAADALQWTVGLPKPMVAAARLGMIAFCHVALRVQPGW